MGPVLPPSPRAALPSLRTALDRSREALEIPAEEPRGYDDTTMAAELAELVQWMIWRRMDAQMDADEAGQRLRRVYRSTREMRARSLARDLCAAAIGALAACAVIAVVAVLL